MILELSPNSIFSILASLPTLLKLRSPESIRSVSVSAPPSILASAESYISVSLPSFP